MNGPIKPRLVPVLTLVLRINAWIESHQWYILYLWLDEFQVGSLQKPKAGGGTLYFHLTEMHFSTHSKENLASLSRFKELGMTTFQARHFRTLTLLSFFIATMKFTVPLVALAGLVAAAPSKSIAERASSCGQYVGRRIARTRSRIANVVLKTRTALLQAHTPCTTIYGAKTQRHPVAGASVSTV